MEQADLLKQAVQYRTKGNEAINGNFLSQAYDHYTEGISFIESHSKDDNAKCLEAGLHLCLSNRALCSIRLENLGAALQDAEAAIKIDPSYRKAHFRRGEAQLGLGQYKKALKTFQVINSPEAKERVKVCQKLVKSALFAAAIQTQCKAPSKTIDFEIYLVKEDYTGPKYSPLLPPSDFKAESDALNPVDFFPALLKFLKANPENVLPSRYVLLMLLDCIEYMRKLPNIVEISMDDFEVFSICGDIHGQFYDLLNIFEINGMPSPQHPYLFNGDIVDRGAYSVECILTLMAAKLAFPQAMHMARGNHETEQMNKIYGFKGEVLAKYSSKVYDIFTEFFCYLPIAHKIQDSILVVHGGLFSNDDVTLDIIQSLERNVEPGSSGVLAELLWSDPQEAKGRKPSKRGMAVEFGPDVTEKFLEKNDLSLIVRSHEVQDCGFSYSHDNKLVTIFSAPNYCDTFANKGAVMRITHKTADEANAKKFGIPDKTANAKKFGNLLIEFTKFDAVSHPPSKSMQYACPMFSY